MNKTSEASAPSGLAPATSDVRGLDGIRTPHEIAETICRLHGILPITDEDSNWPRRVCASIETAIVEAREQAGIDGFTAACDPSEAARSLGAVGGRKGGVARAASLSPERRSEIARKAANARWRPASATPKENADG